MELDKEDGEETTRVITVQGYEMELDLTKTRVFHKYRIGDSISVSVKRFSGELNSYSGIITGFNHFKNLPAIRIAYFETGPSEYKVVFRDINSETTDIEICPTTPGEFRYNARTLLGGMEREVKNMEAKTDELKRTLNSFMYECKSVLGRDIFTIPSNND